MIASLMMQMGNHQNAELNESLLRHMVLNSLRGYRNKFKEYATDNEVVIACDSSSWRRGVFPYYKAARRASKEKSEVNWDLIFSSFDNIKNELKEFFPYRVIRVEGAEADDIIGVIVNRFGEMLSSSRADIIIISGDKDFKQLQKYMNVKQYDPTRKKWLTCSNPAGFLQEHIISGDRSDGIPNILTPDDSFVSNKRAVPMTAKRMKYYMETPYDQLTEEEKRNWNRNKTLIDLDMTPDDISSKIMKAYTAEVGKGRTNLLNYFVKYKLKNLTEYISEF